MLPIVVFRSAKERSFAERKATISSRVEDARPVEAELPDGVKFAGGDVTDDTRAAAIANQERARGSIDLSWSQPIFFYPDGTATAARVALVGQRERAIVIELRSLTGGARIGDIVSQESLRP